MAAKITTLAYLQVADEALVQRAVALVKGFDGIENVYYGRRLEDNSIVDLAIDWSSPNNSNKLRDSLLTGEIFNTIKPNLTGTPTVFSIQHSSGPGTFLDSINNPLTEIATFFFLPGITDEKLGEFDTAFEGLETAVLAQPGQSTADAGHVIGLLDNPDIGASVNGFIATVGWKDLDAHIAFTQTPEFGQSLGALIPFLSGNADHHVKFRRV